MRLCAKQKEINEDIISLDPDARALNSLCIIPRVYITNDRKRIERHSARFIWETNRCRGFI